MIRKIAIKAKQLKSLLEISRTFENPLQILLLRLGILKLPYFPYRFQTPSGAYTMLARPTTTSMADLFVLREVLLHEDYKDVLRHLSKGPLTIVDVGANLGSFTIWLNRKIGVREAFCFEPEMDSQRLLKFNLSINQCPATVIPSAVGGKARTAKIALKRSSPGGTNIYHSAGPDSIDVPVLSFDTWLSATIANFDLLKLDCEGAEWEILQQISREQLRRFPVVIAEVHGDPENPSRPCDEFRLLMEKHGFKTVRFDGVPQGLYLGLRDDCQAI